MGYCPKCDMEFIEGIEICSDCNGALVDKEEYLKSEEERKLQEEKEKEEKIRKYLEENSDELTKQREQFVEESLNNPGVYIKKADKYNDLKSSAAAFYIIGAALLIFDICILLKLIYIPMFSENIILKSAFIIMGAGALYIAVQSSMMAKKIAPEISKEEENSANLIKWFLDTYTAGDIDKMIASDDFSKLEIEEIALKRIDCINDLFLTNHNITDTAYIDSLSEEIYSKLYEKN